MSIQNSKKLCDLVELEANNLECVILKIKEGSELDLMKLGFFNGDEKAIRVTKGDNHTYTIWTNEKHYSWNHGVSGHTIVSNDMDKRRLLIDDCIETDFDIYMGSNTKLINDSLHISCLEDSYHNKHDIEILFWKSSDKSCTVRKDGSFFRRFNNKDDVFKYFEEAGYDISEKNVFVSPNTGCMVEEYSIVRDLENTLVEDIEQEAEEDLER